MNIFLLWCVLGISCAGSAQTTYFAGGYIGHFEGFGFHNPAYIGLVGAETKTEHWYGHIEGTIDSSDKIGNPATAYRGLGELAYRITPRVYLGGGVSASVLQTRDYGKSRQNGRIALGWLGKSFDSHAAYILPFGNPERVQGGEYELVWHVKPHLALLQKYQMLVCKACIDPLFHEHYLAGGMQYGARWEF